VNLYEWIDCGAEKRRLTLESDLGYILHIFGLGLSVIVDSVWSCFVQKVRL